VIELRAGTRIWIAAGVTDMRRGFQGLSAQVQTVLEQQPFSGHVFVFRGRRGDTIKILWFDGDGLCLFAKRLERGRFIWPQATEGTVSLTRAQLSMLMEGARDSPVFMRLLWIFCHRSHGILRSWLPPLFPT
jgi:transposase